MRTRERDDFNFWPVYSDLALSIVLVLLLFLLAQLVFNSRLLITQDLARMRVQRHQANVRARIIGAEGVDSIKVDGSEQTIILSADFLFATDDTTLTANGRRLLGDLSGILHANEKQFTRVQVEGHADYRPSRRFKDRGDSPGYGNWRLSAERAIRVVQLFKAAGLAGGRMAAVGRSSYEPADTLYKRYRLNANAGEVPELDESLRRNRRLVIRLFYSEAPRSLSGRFR
jgi:outer membrane protein OmpA-like peptidoglycan-associated protein